MSRHSSILSTATFLLGGLSVFHSVSSEELPFPTFVRSTDSLEEIQGYVSNEPRRATLSEEGELITERYPNRAVKLQRHVIQDADRNYVNHGTWTMLDPQGRVVAQGEYRNGKRHGSWMRMLPAFPMADQRFRAPFTSQTEFENGELHGTWTILDAQQRVVGSWQFSQGKLDGISTTWYPNGQQRREMTFLRGIPDGEAMAWKPDGNEWAKEFFRDGKQLVPVITWHDRQQKESEGWNIRSNFAINVNVDWWEGVLEITREDGEGEEVKTGTWSEWYANGTKQFEGAFDAGKPVGQHTWWHPSGQKSHAGDYRDGLADGRWTSWHATGMKNSEGTYLAGVQTGTWTTWSEEGLVANVQQMASDTETEVAEADDSPSPAHNVSHILLDD